MKIMPYNSANYTANNQKPNNRPAFGAIPGKVEGLLEVIIKQKKPEAIMEALEKSAATIEEIKYNGNNFTFDIIHDLGIDGEVIQGNRPFIHITAENPLEPANNLKLGQANFYYEDLSEPQAQEKFEENFVKELINTIRRAGDDIYKQKEEVTNRFNNFINGFKKY